MFVVSKLSGTIKKRGEEVKVYDSRKITLGDLRSWLSARINLDHYTKTETSSAIQISTDIAALSSKIDENYSQLEDSKVDFEYIHNHENEILTTISGLSSKVDSGVNWHLVSKRLTEEDDTLEIANRHIYLISVDNEMVYVNFNIANKTIAGTSREFAILIDNSSNIQNVGIKFTTTSTSEAPKFVGANNALDIIGAGFNCLIEFKEVDENKYFVQRISNLIPITANTIDLYSFLSGCEDSNGDIIPYSPSYTIHGLKPFTKIQIQDPPLLTGYTFQTYYGAFDDEKDKIEYKAGDEVILTNNFYLSAQYQSDVVAYIRFYAPEDKTTGVAPLISSYQITNGKISTIDPKTGLPYSVIDYPVLTSIEYDIKWNEKIPEITAVVSEYHIGSTWVKKSIIDGDIGEEDEDDIIVIDNEDRIIADDNLSGLILVGVEETDTDINVLATDISEDFDDGIPATVVAITVPNLDDEIMPT